MHKKAKGERRNLKKVSSFPSSAFAPTPLVFSKEGGAPRQTPGEGGGLVAVQGQGETGGGIVVQIGQFHLHGQRLGSAETNGK